MGPLFADAFVFVGFQYSCVVGQLLVYMCLFDIDIACLFELERECVFVDVWVYMCVCTGVHVSVCV